MDHNWHYDLTDDHQFSQDPESLLVWLCDRCAAELDEKVQFAGADGDYDGPCWRCGA
jgi:hypothetical protein